MFNTLYLLQYNNYYNRLVKKEETLTAYEPYLIDVKQGINFNPADHVTTTQIVNIDDDTTFDYVVVADDANNIVSRWFVIECDRVRAGQYNLILYRDTVADYWNIITSAPCFIEKANLGYDNPLIFNDEQMTVNQIRKGSYLLKDKSDCAWIVGYYDRNQLSEMNGTVPTNNLVPGAIQLNEDIENWEYYKYSNLSSDSKKFLGIPLNQEYVIRTVLVLGDGNLATEWRYYIRSNNGTVGWNDFSWSIRPSISSTNYENTANTISKIITENPTLLSDMNYYSGNYADITTESEWNDFYRFNGATVRDAQGRYFQVNIIDNNTNSVKETAVPSGNMFNTMATVVSKVNQYNRALWGTPDTRSFMIRTEAKEYTIGLVELQLLSTRYNFQSGIVNTLDAPWNIFAMPYNVYSRLSIIDTVNDKTLNTVDNDIYLNAAMAIQIQHPGIVYDVQLLPYCPIPGIITDEHEITLSNSSEFTTITTGENDEIVGYIFHCSTSNFTGNIDFERPKASTAIQQKINNQCDKYRLAAPNYSSYFDFSLEKNGGIKWFNYDCNYKPFTPYVHINPNFGGLYGSDDNSPRGLVLGGDFSLSQVIDQWQQYQVQNKNFQAIFDRQIQNMEINNKYQRQREIFGAVAGSVQGTTSGAYAGGIIGGGWGAAIGAVVGGGTSIAGGVADLRINDRIRREAIDYTKDQFGYQLGNIQALPQTISKVSAFNANNKIFPVLEYYTCTFEEKLAFANKIAYNGMTVMTIGKIQDYIGNAWDSVLIRHDSDDELDKRVYNRNYIKAQVIRLDDLNSEYRVANTIAKEINQGIYIDGGIS